MNSKPDALRVHWQKSEMYSRDRSWDRNTALYIVTLRVNFFLSVGAKNRGLFKLKYQENLPKNMH